MKRCVYLLSLRVHALMQGQLMAALEHKDWSASPPSEVDGMGGPSPLGLTGPLQVLGIDTDSVLYTDKTRARDHKTAKEDYFVALRALNVLHLEYLTLLQGRQYMGFRSMAEGETMSGQLRADPVGVLSWGWLLFVGVGVGVVVGACL